jgi:hypothetical protein
MQNSFYSTGVSNEQKLEADRKYAPGNVVEHLGGINSVGPNRIGGANGAVQSRL